MHQCTNSNAAAARAASITPFAASWLPHCLEDDEQLTRLHHAVLVLVLVLLADTTMQHQAGACWPWRLACYQPGVVKNQLHSCYGTLSGLYPSTWLPHKRIDHMQHIYPACLYLCCCRPLRLSASQCLASAAARSVRSSQRPWISASGSDHASTRCSSCRAIWRTASRSSNTLEA